jgi:tetratricopeptide (TPR) repeat protein
MDRTRLALALAASLVVAACGGDKKKSAKPKEDAAPLEPAKPKKEMPAYEKSGILQDVRKWQDLRSARKEARKKEDKEAADAAVASFVEEAVARWTAKAPPDPEAYYLGILLDAAGKKREAAEATRRYLAVAPEDHVNYANATTLLIRVLGEAGDFDAAEAALAQARGGAYMGKSQDEIGAATSLAMALSPKQPERAAKHFENLMSMGTGDPESAILGVECLLRTGKRDAAVAMAKKATEIFKEGRPVDRIKDLLAATSLVGETAAGRFAEAKHWRGSGSALTDADLQGKVTLVFGWKIDATWATSFFKEMNQLKADYDDKGVQFCGISRLAQFDPVEGGTKKDMTVDQELEFYDRMGREYGWDYPMAIGAIDNPALMHAWGAQATPSLTVVGKDGRIAYTRTGHKPEHVNTVREVLDRETAK